MFGKCRFPRAVVAQYRYKLSRFDIQVYAVDRAKCACGVAFVVSLYIVVYQFLYFDHRSKSFIPAGPGSYMQQASEKHFPEACKPYYLSVTL